MHLHRGYILSMFLGGLLVLTVIIFLVVRKPCVCSSMTPTSQSFMSKLENNPTIKKELSGFRQMMSNMYNECVAGCNNKGGSNCDQECKKLINDQCDQFQQVCPQKMQTMLGNCNQTCATYTGDSKQCNNLCQQAPKYLCDKFYQNCTQ